MTGTGGIGGGTGGTGAGTGGTGGGTGGNGAGTGGSSGTLLGDPSDCEPCEQTYANESYKVARMQCTAATGTASAGTMAGAPKSELCTDVLKCIYQTKCNPSAGNGAIDCLCGTGVDPTVCLGTSFDAASGPCKEQIAAAAETMDMNEINNRFYDPVFAIGLAVAVADCDSIFCPNECGLCTPVGSDDPSCPVHSSGGTGGMGGGTGGVGGGTGGESGGTGPCFDCESMAHGQNMGCPQNLTRCMALAGNTSASSPLMPGVAKATLCQQILDCIHDSPTHCGASANGVTDCLCGTNVDSSACFAGTFAAMTGDCKALMAAGAESDVPSLINSVFYDTTYALGAANAVVETCDQLFCSAQCLESE